MTCSSLLRNNIQQVANDIEYHYLDDNQLVCFLLISSKCSGLVDYMQNSCSSTSKKARAAAFCGMIFDRRPLAKCLDETG